MIAGGRRFAVQRVGAGSPVVLVHGSGIGALTWRGIVPRLVGAGREVHVIELLGYGGSDPPGDGSVLEDDLAGVLALARDVGPAHLVGHSYGGLLALLAASQVPVARLSLLEPVAFGILHDTADAEGLADLDRFERSFPGVFDPTTGGDATWLAHFVDYWNGAGTWAASGPRQREAQLRVGRKVFREVLAVRDARPDFAPLDRLGGAVDLIRGDRTTPAARRVMARLAERLGVPEHVLPGVGHVFPIVRPEETAALLLRPGWRSPSGG